MHLQRSKMIPVSVRSRRSINLFLSLLVPPIPIFSARRHARRRVIRFFINAPFPLSLSVVCACPGSFRDTYQCKDTELVPATWLRVVCVTATESHYDPRPREADATWRGSTLLYTPRGTRRTPRSSAPPSQPLFLARHRAACKYQQFFLCRATKCQGAFEREEKRETMNSLGSNSILSRVEGGILAKRGRITAFFSETEISRETTERKAPRFIINILFFFTAA